MGRRSSGGTNCGDAHLSQSKLASTNGLCLPSPPHAAERFTTTSRPITPQHRPAQEHPQPQRPGLPIRGLGRGLVLVEAQPVERQAHRRERRLRRVAGLQTKPVRRQVVLELLDPPLHAGPPVVVAPQLHRPLAAMGHPHPEGVARHVQELPPHRPLGRPDALAHRDEAPRLGPAKELHGELARRVVLINGTPRLDSGALALEVPGQARHHHLGQLALLQKIQERSVEETAVGAHRAQPRPLGQECQRLFEEGHDTPRRARVPTAQPAVQNELRLKPAPPGAEDGCCAPCAGD
jgi:hypothetical protein